MINEGKESEKIYHEMPSPIENDSSKNWIKNQEIIEAVRRRLVSMMAVKANKKGIRI